MRTKEMAVPAAPWAGEATRVAGIARALALGLALAVAAALSAQPISWGGRTGTATATSGTTATRVDPGLLRAARHAPSSSLEVIVREAIPASSSAEELVRSLGGTVTRELGLVGSFAARLPARAIDRLGAAPSVIRVWGNARLTTEGYGIGKYDTKDPNFVWKVATGLPAAHLFSRGAGVGVALIDTGVVPTPGLRNRVVYRMDFTGERDGYDRFGHGTHLAGLIAGDPTGATNNLYGGVAPKANLISVKVGGWDGGTDVSTVIAGLQWVVNHREEFNIRVVNLSYGTDSKQPYAIDPLDYAVERTWFAGVMVVVSAGNIGPGDGTITKPGDDPFVLTVGGADLGGTVTKNDDTVPGFSSRGPTQDGLAKPDIVAPAISMLSDRDTNSVIDQQHPAAVVGGSYFKGTGTSQAAAVVSGTAALMFAEDPGLTPDAAKYILLRTANRNITTLPDSGIAAPGSGSGMVDVLAAVVTARTRLYDGASANRGLTPSVGTGSLEASRGSAHVVADLDQDGVPEVVTGEVDVLGQTDAWGANAWGADAWAANGWAAKAWGSSDWNANGWDANAWGGFAWSANAWGANAWGANGWGANAWGANGWGANGWGANAWGANGWGANAWGANAWGANAWG
jgi:serine protease AprX